MKTIKVRPWEKAIAEIPPRPAAPLAMEAAPAPAPMCTSAKVPMNSARGLGAPMDSPGRHEVNLDRVER
jgi:hypothetical protein